MARDKKAILEQLATKAIRLGADEIEVEYKDGCEEVFAVKSEFGVGIASLRSSNPQTVALRKELYALTKQKRRMTLDNLTYEMRARIFDSFGEDALRVKLRRL
jgi:hypothetical protein